MRVRKGMCAALLTVMLLLAMSAEAFAHDAPDASMTGSVSVAMTYEGEAVSGGTLTLYQVGGIYENDGNYSFVLTGDFAGSGASLEDIQSAGLAAGLADYAAANELTGTQAQIGEDGTATVSGLTLGLYLVVQTGAADGFEAVSPFLVSVPMNEDGAYVYDVDATPKLSPLTAAPAPTASPKPAGPTLPQTGQLNWPVPMLAAAGLGLFCIGWALRFGKKKEGYEK